MIDSLNRGDAVAASTWGLPPALLTTTSTRPHRRSASLDQGIDLLGIADVAREERRAATLGGRQLRRFGSAAREDVGAEFEEPFADRPADALGAAGDDARPGR